MTHKSILDAIDDMHYPPSAPTPALDIPRLRALLEALAYEKQSRGAVVGTFTYGPGRDFTYEAAPPGYVTDETLLRSLAQRLPSLVESERDTARVTAENRKLRELLWLRHHGTTAPLYGDDGHRDCNACLIDFKHDTAEQIEARFWVIASAALSSPEAPR